MTGSTSSEERRSIGDTLASLGHDIPELLRSELRLLKAEAAESGSRAAQAGIGAVAGLLVGTVALLVLVQALVLALAQYMPGWLASTIVGLLLAGIALVMVLRSKRDLKPEALLPDRSIESVSRDKNMIKEKMS